MFPRLDSVPQTGPYLPPELIDHILDHCHADKFTLVSSSLVSRSFNTTCRYHLFAKNIDISNVPETVSETRTKESQGQNDNCLKMKNINPASSAASFIHLITTPSSTIAPFLQELSLILRPRGKEVPGSAWFDELVSLLPATKIDCKESASGAAKSPFHLRTLRVFRHGVDLSDFALAALHQNFPAITSLSFFETTVQRRSLRKDMEWVCGFENLEDLLFYGHHRANMKRVADINLPTEVDSSDWASLAQSFSNTFDLNKAVNADGITTIRLPQSVRSLRLDLPGSALEAVMEWLLSHADKENKEKDTTSRVAKGVPHVSSLHLFRVTNDEVPSLRAYLRECADTLENILLFLYQKITNREDFDFSEHTALRTLFVASHGFKPMHDLYEIVSSVRSCQMKKLLLQFPYWQLGNDSDAWEALDTLLSTSNSDLTVSGVIDEARIGDTYSNDKLKARLPLSIGTLKANFTIVKRGDQVIRGYVDEVYGRMSTF